MKGFRGPDQLANAPGGKTSMEKISMIRMMRLITTAHAKQDCIILI